MDPHDSVELWQPPVLLKNKDESRSCFVTKLNLKINMSEKESVDCDLNLTLD